MNLGTYLDLDLSMTIFRLKVCDFACTSPEIREVWREFFGHADLAEYIATHKTEGKWANDFLVTSTALFLGLHS